MWELVPKSIGILMVIFVAPFLIVVLLGICVIGISRALAVLWSRVSPLRSFYYLICAPGVIIHECSHIFGCLVTGATVKKVVFFSEKGGSVSYSASKIPYFGDVVISIAPLFCIPLVLTGCTWVFSQFLGCVFPPLPLTVDSPDALLRLWTGVAGMFAQNLIIRFNPWFPVYLYLTLSLVLSLSPSMQDFKNAATGICAITLIGILILWSGLPLAVTILGGITYVVGIGFTLGIVFGSIALVFSSPLIFWFMHKRS